MSVCAAFGLSRCCRGTHAYIVSAETAERLALLGSHMIERARRHAFQRAASWQLDGHGEHPFMEAAHVTTTFMDRRVLEPVHCAHVAI